MNNNVLTTLGLRVVIFTKRFIITLLPETICRSVAKAGQYVISQCSSGDTLYGFTCALVLYGE